MELDDGHCPAQKMTVSINDAWLRLCRMVGHEELELEVKLEQRVLLQEHIMTIFKVELYCNSK